MSASEKYFGERGRDLRRVYERRTFQVQTLWNTHREIIRHAVLGLKGKEIADAIGVTPATVSYTLNSPVVKQEVAIMQAERDAKTVDLAVRIREFAPKCADYLESVILGMEDGVAPGQRIRTAQDYMSRGGYPPIHRLQVASLHMTPEDLEDIKRRAKFNGIVKPAEVINAT